jgi:hypothetical protein
MAEREPSPDEAAAELWRDTAAGLAWKLRPYQAELYAEVWAFLEGKRPSRKLFVDCHRRYGKSFVLFLVGVEVCLGKSDVWPERRRVCRFAAPTTLDLEEIYTPIAEDLFDDCPDELRPLWQSSRGRGHFWFPSTDSRLYLFGTDAKHYRKARGKSCHLGVVDEAGACEPGCPEGIKHVVNSILLPQTFHVNGRIVMATTPPETPAHDSHALKADAQAAGTYIRRTLDENARFFGAAAVAEYERESGGRDSSTFRREYLCEWIVDQARAIVPEFDDAKAARLVAPVKAPTHETPLNALDVGFEDFSHVLFGYYDFRRAKLCIQRETRIRRMRTDQLAAAVTTVERELWPEWVQPGARRHPTRISDVDPRLIADMAALHGLNYVATSKDELEAMVNNLRLWVQTDRLEIDPSCEHLIRQLKTAIWNKARTAFDRSSIDGHFDGVAALIYMLRGAPIHTNPYPAFGPEVTPQTHQIRPVAQQGDATLRAIFGGRKNA